MFKIAYKTCIVGSLPKSYQLKLKQVFNHKKDDFPLVVKVSTYYFTVWSIDLPVMYSNYNY